MSREYQATHMLVSHILGSKFSEVIIMPQEISTTDFYARHKFRSNL